MRPFVFLLRIYSVALHLTLSFFLLALAAISTHAHLNIVFYPIPYALLIARHGAFKLGAIGLVCTMLALTRYFKFAFLVWTAVTFYLLVHSLLTDSEDYSRQSNWLAIMVGLAFIAAVWGFRMQRRKEFL